MLDSLLTTATGALFALAGVWLANRHDAKHRERERQLALRRDVYLNAAEGLAGQQQYLSHFANPDLPVNEFAQLLRSNPGWQNKIQFAASLPTITAFAEADTFFGVSLLDLMPLRQRLDAINRELGALPGRREQLGQYQHYLHTSLEGQVQQFPDSSAIAAASLLKGHIDSVQQEVARIDEQEAEHLSERAQLIKTLLELVINRVAEYRLLVARAVLLLRDEMAIPLPGSEYIALTERTNATVQQAFQSLLSNADRKRAKVGS